MGKIYDVKNYAKAPLHSWFALLILLIGMFWLPLAAGAKDSVCAEVKIEIKQELTLERQAFEAHMRINNGLSSITLEDVSVTVNFLDEESNPVQATSNPDTNLDTTLIPFFIRLDSTNNLSNLQIEPTGRATASGAGVHSGSGPR